MARYPGAHWRPISGHTDGRMSRHLGAVLHVNQSNGNLFNWFNGDHNVSAHFEVYKNGAVEQYLDTDVSSWCQMAGNDTYVSIETEGYVAEPLTDAQVTAIAKLYAWLHRVHGIPFRLAEHPGQTGFGWHGMGGADWGGHTGCPGPHRKAQRAGILLRAKTIGASGTSKTPKPAPAPHPTEPVVTLPKDPPKVTPDQHRYMLFTLVGGKGPVYASAPGRWHRVNTHDVAVLINAGLVAPYIHQRVASSLATLRAASIGANS